MKAQQTPVWTFAGREKPYLNGAIPELTMRVYRALVYVHPGPDPALTGFIVYQGDRWSPVSAGRAVQTDCWVNPKKGGLLFLPGCSWSSRRRLQPGSEFAFDREKWDLEGRKRKAWQGMLQDETLTFGIDKSEEKGTWHVLKTGLGL